MVYIGVDPGKKGGWAVIAESETGTLVKSYPWDDVFFVTDMRALAAMHEQREGNIVAAVEKVGAMPGQGVTSMFTFGQGYGFILGVLTALGIPFQVVPPREWKKEFGLNSDKSKSIEVCHRLFPDVDLKRTEKCRTDSDGKAEALLIAEWCRRKM